MSSDFEWHFGDELPDEQTEEEQMSQRSRRRWLPWFLALLLVASGVYAWWRGRQRNLAQIEAQVQQVAQLELRALAEGDRELYLSLQDPFDRSWQKAQAAYVDTAGLPLPLQGLTTPISTSVESARVVGDRAQVEIVHTATLPSSEEVSFRAVRLYRYTSDGRWLHTRADRDEGGHSVTFVMEEVKIMAFDKDADWIRPLTSDLIAVPYRFCSLTSCRQDISLELNLAADLEESAPPEDHILPAPFLVGAPENDAAQATWEESLGQFIVDVLVTREAGPRHKDDHRGELVEERLRAWLKAELGVSQPVPPDLELVREALDTQTWVPIWRLWIIGPDDPDRPVAAAEVDLLLRFIEEEQGTSAVAELLHALRDAYRLAELLGDVGRPSWTFEGRFLAYVREQIAESAEELADFASYDPLMRCSVTVESVELTETWGWWLDRPEEAVLVSARPANEDLIPFSRSPNDEGPLVEREPRYGNDPALPHAGSAELERGMIPSNAQPASY